MKSSAISAAPDYRVRLAELFEEKKRLNPAFSLRAFARLLGVSPASISQVLSGKRHLSRKLAREVAQRLGFSPLETQEWMQGHLRARYEEQATETPSPYQLLELDRFNLISDWYHYAILSLSEVKAASAKPEWIARRLNITRAQAVDALARLERLKLIEIRGGKFRQTVPPLDTPNGVPSAALRKHHSQILHKADLAQHEMPIEEREYGTLTMAVNPARLPQARERLRALRDELSAILENGKRERVYILSYQLFPLDRSEESLH